MSTLTELIRISKQYPIRRCYIKRRDTNGDYEADWQRIDNYNGVSRVKNWGSISIEIDWQPGQIATFNVSNLTVQFRNDDGLFNVETDERSVWDGYLNRQKTKLKIECGYMDTDGSTEVGVASIFEGYIDRVQVSDNQIAKVTVLSYQNVLQGYDFSDLSLSGTDTVNNIVNAIMNQSKITTYIPYVAADAAQNKTIVIASLSGSYWDVIKQLSLVSGSVPKLVADTWSFIKREVDASSSFDFVGKGSSQISDIFKISKYDDEGADRVVTKWFSSEGETAETADATLRTKYPNDKDIDLSLINTTGDRQDIVDELLAQWENPKPVINFETRFLVNTLEPLNKITLDVLGETYPTDIFIWDAFNWIPDEDNIVNGAPRWGGILGAITLNSSDSWMVTKVEKNINSWSTKIVAEKQP